MSALIPAIIKLLMKGRGGGGGGGGGGAPQKSDQEKHQDYWNRELLKMLADKSGPDINIGGGRGGGSRTPCEARAATGSCRKKKGRRRSIIVIEAFFTFYF